MSAPNVLLLVLDSVRAKNTGLYGHHRDTTPFLSGYSERATLYRQARAPGIHSVASHASMWTGAEVEEHQVTAHEDELRSNTTIWEELDELGYDTGLFTTNPVVAHASNLSEPFDHVVTNEFVDKGKKPFPDAHSPVDVVKHEGVSGNLRRCLRDDRPLRALVNSAYHFYAQQRERALAESLTSVDVVEGFLEWQRESDRPWAACINLMDAHFPYEPRAEYDRWGGAELHEIHSSLSRPPANEFIQGRPWWQLEAFEHLYDGTILELDSHVERIVDELERRGVHDDTLVVVTSDHGEGFGEVSRLTGRMRLITHSWGIHEILTHVPLLVKYPGQEETVVSDELASLTAFPGAVRSVLDGERDYDTFGAGPTVVSSTYRLLEEDAGIFDGSDEDPDEYFGPWRAVYERTDGVVHKYVTRLDEHVEVEIRDAQNSSVVSRERTDAVEEAFAGLEPLDIKRPDRKDLPDEVEDRLTDLGYVR